MQFYSKYLWPCVFCATLFEPVFVKAISLNINDTASIKSAANIIAKNAVSYYVGNLPGKTPGLLPYLPYYWWESGGFWGTLIDYWYYTGDEAYNAITTQGLLFQVGQYNNYEPQNQTFDLGNDDQAFWAMSVLNAAELNFPNPPASEPQWLSLAQAVFNRQAARWDPTTCGGGIRWSFNSFTSGWAYKNSPTNGFFFNIAARLGKYTGNQTYVQWAEKTWDWMSAVGLIDHNFYIYDGTDVNKNCSDLNHIQWTYSPGALIYGAASLWNMTGSDVWRFRLQGLLNATDVFFQDNVMVEVACEALVTCDTEKVQLSFKAYFSRWLAMTTLLAPWTYDQIMAHLRPSAQAAAAQCTGGSSKTNCGLRWTLNGTWDGTTGAGQEMAALEVIQSMLIQQVQGPVSGNTGGTSQGDPSAGTGATGGANGGAVYGDVLTGPTTAAMAGAGVLTALLAIVTIGGALWMIS